MTTDPIPIQTAFEFFMEWSQPPFTGAALTINKYTTCNVTRVFTTKVLAVSRLLPLARLQIKIPNTPLTIMNDTNTTCQTMRVVSNGSLAGRGARFMISLVAGSNARVSPKVTAVIMFTHKICAAVTGSDTPKISAARMVHASPPLVGKVHAITFFRLS